MQGHDGKGFAVIKRKRLIPGRAGFDGGIAVDKEGRVQFAWSLTVQFPAEWSQDLPWSTISLMSPS